MTVTVYMTNHSYLSAHSLKNNIGINLWKFEYSKFKSGAGVGLG